MSITEEQDSVAAMERLNKSYEQNTANDIIWKMNKAVEFLTSDELKSIPLNMKKKFLLTKGFAEGDIHEALIACEGKKPIPTLSPVISYDRCRFKGNDSGGGIFGFMGTISRYFLLYKGMTFILEYVHDIFFSSKVGKSLQPPTNDGDETKIEKILQELASLKNEMMNLKLRTDSKQKSVSTEIEMMRDLLLGRNAFDGSIDVNFGSS